KNLKNYGNVHTDYILVKGSVQGPVKRQLLLTRAIRETKKRKKKEFELIELR
ncbi:MAG: 50S ribosomal protein L3, partial [Nanoarchaeota archaeon]|nr:50S ribosomal protein L3 [Nanoarchaeota archaeon]